MATAGTGGTLSRRGYLKAMALLTLSAGLAACGGSQAAVPSGGSPQAAAATTNAPAAAQATAAPAPANAAAGAKTMVFWVQGDPAAKSPFNDNRAQFNKEFEDQQKVTLKLEGVVQRIDEKLLIAGAAGDQPDLTMYSSQMVGAHQHAGTLRATDDYFNTEADSWRKDLLPVGLSAITATADHKMYGLLQGLHSRVLYYRKDLIDTVPQSWDDLLAAGKKGTDEAKGNWGWIFDAEKTWSVEVDLGPFVWEQNAALADPTTGKAAWATDATVKAIQLHRDALYKDKISPISTVTNKGYGDTWKMFDGGQAAMAVNGTYQLPDLKKNATQLWDGDKVWATPIPWPSGGHSANFANGWAYGIPRLSKEPQLAWKWIQTWNTPKAQIADALVEGAAPTTSSAWTDKAFEGDKGIWHGVFFPNLEKNGHPMDNFIFYIEALDALSEAYQTLLLNPNQDIMAALKDAQDHYNGNYFGG